MSLVRNKVGDDGTDKALADGKTLVESLVKVSCSKYEAILFRPLLLLLLHLYLN